MIYRSLILLALAFAIASSSCSVAKRASHATVEGRSIAMNVPSSAALSDVEPVQGLDGSWYFVTTELDKSNSYVVEVTPDAEKRIVLDARRDTFAKSGSRFI